MKRIFCFLMTLSLSLLPVLYASGEAGIPPVHPEQDIDPGEDTSQDDYWAGSGLEFLWDTLYLKDPQPLSDEEQRAFFRRYAAEMKLVSFSPSEDVSGSFSIRENGSFHVDYRSGRPPEYSDTSGEGSFTGVIRLSDWVFALVPGAVQWASLEDEFVLQEVMLFQIPGAKEDDPGILKTDLQNIASLTKADPQSPVPFCFIRAFDNSPLWAGTAGKELLPQNSPESTSRSGSAEAALAQILQEHESAIHAFQKLRLQTWEGTDLISCPVCPVGLADLNGDGNRELLFLEMNEDLWSSNLSIWSADTGIPRRLFSLTGATRTGDNDSTPLEISRLRNGSILIEYETDLGWGVVCLAPGREGLVVTDHLLREDDGLQGKTDPCSRNGQEISLETYKALLSGWQSSKAESLCAFPWEKEHRFGFELSWEEAMHALGVPFPATSSRLKSSAV